MSVLAQTPGLDGDGLPTEDDLPYDDGVPMESHWHVLQMSLLIDTLTRYWADRPDAIVGGNMFVYYYSGASRTPDSVGPDVYVGLGVPRRARKSWLVWREGKAPDLVIELLSDSTELRDRTKKKQIYQDLLKVPEYFWCDPDSGEFAGFVLRNGVYQEIPPDPDGRLWSAQTGLALVCQEGEHLGIQASWLRWVSPSGELLPTAEELQRRAEQEHHRAEQEQRRAEQERHRADEEGLRADQERQRADEERLRADRLAARLRELGIDPDG